MPYKLNVDLPAVNADYDYAILTGKTDLFPYENGKRISDVREGVKLTIALQGARLAPLTIKFDHDPLPNLTDEQIDDACRDCNFIYVQLPDCAVNLYSSSNSGIGMTATAQTAKIVALKSDK